MIDCNQLEPVCVEGFLQFIRNAQLITAVSLFQLITSNANVFDRIRFVVTAGFFQITHFATTHKVCDELETLAIPGVKERT